MTETRWQTRRVMGGVAEVARQNTTYNQPSHPSFYLASDLDWSKVPIPAR